MRGHNTGWCNYCNASVCPCGSCGCANSCGCSCGRKTVLQQSVSSCCTPSAGTRFCREPVTYLLSSFTVPAANIEIEISVAVSDRLYVGQGIRIGDFFFQVTEIVDSTTIKIAHSGTATVGFVLTAVSATYGCYQYPIYYVGIVDINYVPEEIVGVDSSFDPIADSVIDPIVSFTYGYLGPNKIQFNLEINAELDLTPDFLSVPLPDSSATPGAVFSAILNTAGVPSPLVAYKDGTNLIVGPGGGVPFTDGVGLIIQVSGEYGI